MLDAWHTLLLAQGEPAADGQSLTPSPLASDQLCHTVTSLEGCNVSTLILQLWNVVKNVYAHTWWSQLANTVLRAGLDGGVYITQDWEIWSNVVEQLYPSATDMQCLRDYALSEARLELELRKVVWCDVARKIGYSDPSTHLTEKDAQFCLIPIGCVEVFLTMGCRLTLSRIWTLDSDEREILSRLLDQVISHVDVSALLSSNQWNMSVMFFTI